MQDFRTTNSEEFELNKDILTQSIQIEEDEELSDGPSSGDTSKSSSPSLACNPLYTYQDETQLKEVSDTDF
jgi:hypothetical protein